MLKFLKKILSLSNDHGKKTAEYKNDSISEYKYIKVSDVLEDNKKSLRKILDRFPDLIIREIKIMNSPEFGAMLVYLNNMIETNIIEETIIKKLTDNSGDSAYPPGSREYSKYLFGIRNEDIHRDMNKVISSILSGGLILFIEGLNEALVINISKPPGRSIEEPQVETVIRGPREGFTESLSTNITLLRKKIKSANFKMELLKLGRETNTDVAIIYLSNIANPEIIKELRERLSKIDIDSVIGINYLKEYIEDDPLGNFPTIFSTERPDTAAAKILEGRVAVISDGTPLVITVPSLFIEFLISNEDYYLKFIPATINRWIRYVCFAFSLLLPGVYLAITTFHPEVIPTPLLITFIKARSKVPYSELIECLLMLLMYEILREAGIRMPRTVGQAMSVVGALVLGQAAVEAGIVSTPMVIVVATTAICSFAIPYTDMYAAMVLPRLIFVLLGGFAGLLGITCGLVIMFMKLISTRSFGIPYMAPMAPFISKEIPDLFMRRPLWSKFTRLKLVTGKLSIKRKPQSHIKAIKEDQKKQIEEKENEE